MKPNLIATLIILTIIGITVPILNVVMNQPIEPICEEEGSPMLQEWCEKKWQ